MRELRPAKGPVSGICEVVNKVYVCVVQYVYKSLIFNIFICFAMLEKLDGYQGLEGEGGAT
jgi:hypothetical protein